ncbi:hypothetical protein [Nostoc sp.]
MVFFYHQCDRLNTPITLAMLGYIAVLVPLVNLAAASGDIVAD